MPCSEWLPDGESKVLSRAVQHQRISCGGPVVGRERHDVHCLTPIQESEQSAHGAAGERLHAVSYTDSRSHWHLPQHSEGLLV